MRRIGLSLLALAACGRAPLTDTLDVCVDAPPAPPAPWPPCQTFTRDLAFEAFVGNDPGTPAVVAVAGTGASDLYVALWNDFRGRVGHWDGAAWADEPLPPELFSITSLTLDPDGDVWALGATRGPTRSGVGGSTLLVHRAASGLWSAAPPPAHGGVVAVGGTASGLFASTIDEGTSALGLWRRRAGLWVETPFVPPSGAAAARAQLSVGRFWGGPCGQAIAFGGGATPSALFGVMFRLAGDRWDSVPVPVLSDVQAVSGPSLDDLTVLALNRGRDEASHLFHLTGGLATWTPVLTPATVQYLALWSPSASRAVAVGCEWPDHTKAPAGDCARLTTIDGDAVSTTPLAGVVGSPTALWAEPGTGALHLFTAAPDAAKLDHPRHHVALATCP